MSPVSAHEFARALKQVEPQGKWTTFLTAHAEAPARAMNAASLADVADYDGWRGINLQYGLLAERLGLLLGRPSEGLGLLCEFAEPKTVTNEQWILIMRPQFAEGLRLAGWID